MNQGGGIIMTVYLKDIASKKKMTRITEYAIVKDRYNKNSLFVINFLRNTFHGTAI